MDPRAGEGRVGILPWIGPPEKSRGRKQKGGRGCVLIRGERERERGDWPCGKLDFRTCFVCSVCSMAFVGRKGRWFQGEEFREGSFKIRAWMHRIRDV